MKCVSGKNIAISDENVGTMAQNTKFSNLDWLLESGHDRKQ